jgi:hypothetical protein
MEEGKERGERRKEVRKESGGGEEEGGRKVIKTLKSMQEWKKICFSLYTSCNLRIFYNDFKVRILF